ncbi:MAG: trigger factor [Spirochaetales bacterium]|nr:trigger factor [Spirochaetales bacterium]
MATETKNDETAITFNSNYDVKENSRIQLTLTVPSVEVKKEFEQLTQKYCREAHIRGFRKGRVPADVLIRKFGDSIKAETEQTIIQKALEEAFKESDHQPLPYAYPELEEKSDLDIDKDFTFTICYDTFPKVELGKYKGLTIQKLVPDITEGDVEREVTHLQDQNAFVVPKEGGAVEKGDVVTMDYVEIDDSGAEIEKTLRNGFTFTAGSGYNLYKIDEDIIGMKKGEEKTINKRYPEDYELTELAGKTVNLKVTITEIKEKKMPALDDEFAQDISEKYKTLTDLKNDIRSKMDEMGEKKAREDAVNQIIEKIVETSTITLPRSMVERELEMHWQNLIRRTGGNERLLERQLENEGKSKTTLFDEWRIKVEQDVRASLVAEEIIKKESIAVDDQEINAELAKAADRQDMSVEQVREDYEKKGLMHGLKMMLQHEKLNTLLLDVSSIKKGKKVKYLDLMQGNY